MTSADAGWYDDGSGRQRYWDGAGWGPYAEPAAEPDGAPQGQSSQSLPTDYRPYIYHSELLSMTERWVGRTGSGSHDATAPIAQRLTELSMMGWEFVTTTRVPVVGKMFKADDVRTLTVALFRRPAS